MSTVILASPQRLVRAALAAVIQRLSDNRVVDEASDREQLRLALFAAKPDVVVLDRSLGGSDSEFGELVALVASATRVVVLGAASDLAVRTAVEAGATGVLSRNATAQQLLAGLDTAVSGGLAVILDTARLVPPVPDDELPSPVAPKLSRRELQVVRLLAAGHDSAALADTLQLSPLTIKTHISRVLGKVGVRDRGQLVAFAYATGLVAPPVGARPRTTESVLLRAAS